MILQYSPFILIYLGSCLIGLYLLHYTRRLPDTPGLLPLQGICTGASIWALAYALELVIITPGGNIVTTAGEYLGIFILVPSLLFFVLSYTGRARYITRRNVLVIALPLILFYLAMITNPLHSLYYTSITPYSLGDLVLFVYEYGPIFWIAFLYLMALVGFSLSLLLAAWIDYPSFYRPQIGLLILAIILPILTSGVYVAKLGPAPGLQITPVIFLLVAGILVFASAKYKLFTILPRTQCSIPDILPDGILIADETGAIIYQNRASVAYLASGDAIGKGISDAIPPFPPGEETQEHAMPDGRILEMRRYLLAGTGADDQCIIIHDITNRRMAEVNLREANRKLSLLSSVTRHDIVNQIAVAQSAIELVRFETDDPTILRYLAATETAVLRIHSEIEFTRIYQDLGSQEPQWQPLLSVISPPCCLPLTLSCGEYTVHADPMLPKVFENLFDNAIRHGNEVTGITISCEEVAGELQIMVADDGIGIPEDLKERIFDHGFGGNTGLGLFLIREILAITGISIIEDGVSGEGARFLITVPEGRYRVQPVSR
ncbi:two-component sensor histidine kinase [Methanocalculus alkaliphilus]|uniref:sensor histidine kinase n=1 Tax=Methanocalculus alkaliphilus TaxID=768730 RepID=UPI00209D4D8F|nr:histidine kinase N-terminal 7TM domain-containing protein [Methanocalculus alkaliphilus]MCP1715440.1 two-component sensor histidine kinase [Methanocalculus alkaliphilus]